MKAIIFIGSFLLSILSIKSNTKEIRISPTDIGTLYFEQVQSDCETGKNVRNYGRINLQIVDGTQVKAQIYFKTWEPDDNYSIGEIHKQVTIYNAPSNFKINRIIGDQSWEFGPYKDESRNNSETPRLVPNSCPWRVVVNARRDKNDICGEGYVEVNANLRDIVVEIYHTTDEN